MTDCGAGPDGGPGLVTCAPVAAAAGGVVVDAAGARVGGAARYLEELRCYLERSRRGDVTVIGAGRGVGPGWLLRREAGRGVLGARRRVALNNVGFCGPGGERWTLLRNALHFLSAGEEAGLDGELLARARRQAAIVRLAARRSDVLVVPSTAMAGRVTQAMPGLSGRVVVRPHPVSACPAPVTEAEPAIACPVLFAPYKRMPQRLRELLAALDACADPGVRVWVTADHAEVPADLAACPRVDLLGRRGPAESSALVAPRPRRLLPQRPGVVRVPAGGGTRQRPARHRPRHRTEPGDRRARTVRIHPRRPRLAGSGRENSPHHPPHPRPRTIQPRHLLRLATRTRVSRPPSDGGCRAGGGT